MLSFVGELRGVWFFKPPNAEAVLSPGSIAISVYDRSVSSCQARH